MGRGMLVVVLHEPTVTTRAVFTYSLYIVRVIYTPL